MLKKKIFTLFVVLLLFVSSVFSYVALRHFVDSGDTIESICKTYQLPVPVFLDWNRSEKPLGLYSGQVVTIPFPSGYVYKVKEGDSLSWVSCAFFADMNVIALSNSLKSPYLLKIDQEIFIPFAEVGKTFYIAEDMLLWPVYGEISSPFGMRIHPITGIKSLHTGLDIAAPEGTPIFAAEAGTVTMAGVNGGYGIMIEISTKTDKYRYGHLSYLCVYIGQVVRKGEIIGRVGSTGDTTGPHLHFEVRNSKNEAIDPIALLPNIKNIYPKH
jgi:murein DD-endopeptidase MepM/ murein hydrolase activator NlpD